MSGTLTIVIRVPMTNFKTVRVIRLNDQVVRMDVDGLGLSATAGGSSIVTNLTSIGDVVGGASNGDVIVWDTSSSQWIPGTVTTAVTASDVLPPYPSSTEAYGITTNESGGYRWRKLKDQDHYIAFAISLNATPNTLEKGRTYASASLTISVCNSTDFPPTGYTAVLINGTAATDVTGVFPNLIVGDTITDPTTISITVNASAESDTDTDSVSWRWRKYWGVNSATALTHVQVEALTSQALSTSRLGTYSFNASQGGYLWVVYPQSFGTAVQFTVGGLATTFTEYNIDITNTYAATAAYYTYKSQELQFGTAVSVVVT